MKKVFLLSAIVLCFSMIANAQIKESFDSNSLEWTECPYDSDAGSAIITEGKMIVKSNGEKYLLGTKVRETTVFETHCYMPIDIMKPFQIKSIVSVKNIDDENVAGIIFNYKDNGTFYSFSINEDWVEFTRYVDGKIVGAISQVIKWKKWKKVSMEWELISDGSTLEFFINGISMLKVRHMPLEYTGFGYCTVGDQELEVDEVTFIQ